MNPFWNSAERRVRSLIRIALTLLLFLLFALGLVFILSDLLMPLLPENTPLLTIRIRNNFLLGELTSPMIALGATLLAMFLGGRFLDKRPFWDFGFHRQRKWWQDFFFGLGLGALLMALVFFLQAAFGWIHIKGFFLQNASAPFWVGFMVDLIAFICVGFYEEMLMRGYILRNLAEGLNLRWLTPRRALLLATFLSSIFFSFLHLGNPGASLMSFFNIFLAGIFLSLGFILTGELALPIGLHIAWNFFQGVVFGFPVSGVPAVNPIISIEQLNQGWMTGGMFGPEAGGVGILVMLLGSIFILMWVRRRKGEVSLETRLAVYQGTNNKVDIGSFEAN